MGATKHIKQAMIDKDLKVGKLAELLNKDSRVLSNNLYRDSWVFKEVETIADILGCDVCLVDKKTGKIY